MMKRHTIRKSVTGGLLAVGIAVGGLVTATGAQAATPAYYGAHHRVEGRVVSHGPLNIRYHAGTNHRISGRIGSGRHVWISCQAGGSDVAGNRHWYRLAGGRGWVSARYVNSYRPVRWCNS